MPGEKNKSQGLMPILMAIFEETPGVKLEHLEIHEERRGEPWETADRKIATVEEWMGIVHRDYQNAPSQEARNIISGPYYRWYRDDWGRAIILANHRGEFVPMFEELWAGDPLS